MAAFALAVTLPAALLAACSDGSSKDSPSSTTTTTTTASPNASTTAANGGSTTTEAKGATTTSAAEEGVASAAAAAPSSGCQKPAPASVLLERQALTIDGTERWWRMTVPKAASERKPLSLVVDFHGLLEGADIHSKMSGFSDYGEKVGFFVATPNGTGTPVHWGFGGGADAIADRAFVKAMLADLESRYCIDTNRVYATGLSNGAMISSSLACEMSDTFAAVAPIAGVMDISACTSARVVPMMAVHGTADPILHFDGTIGSIPGLGGAPLTTAPPASTTTTAPADLNGPGYPSNVAAWAKRNGCDPKATDTDVTKAVILRTYSCPANAEVEFYIVKGGGHSWPGSEFSKAIANVVGPTTFDINATELAWKFFTRHALTD